MDNYWFKSTGFNSDPSPEDLQEGLGEDIPGLLQRALQLNMFLITVACLKKIFLLLFVDAVMDSWLFIET